MDFLILFFEATSQAVLGKLICEGACCGWGLSFVLRGCICVGSQLFGEDSSHYPADFRINVKVKCQLDYSLQHHLLSLTGEKIDIISNA